MTKKDRTFKIESNEKADIINTFINTAPESIFIVDRDRKIIFANSTFAERIGRPIEDILGSGFYDIFPAHVAQRRGLHLEQVFAKRKKLSLEDERDGRHFIAYYNPIFSKDDTVEKVLIIAFDITEKKKAELALEEKEKTYRNILENLSVGFFRSTPEGRFIMVNKALATLYGYSHPHEMVDGIKDIGRQVFVLSEDRVNFVETLEKYDYIENFESRQYRKDGGIIWTLSNARRVKDDEGKTIYYEGTIIDITSRRQLEGELLEEKEKFAILVENAPIAMALIDKDGTYIYVNRKFNEIFGYELSDIPNGKVWFKYAFPNLQSRKEAISYWKDGVEPLKIGESIPRVFTITCKDGSRKRININCVVLAQRLYIITYEDITEKERIEARYRSIFENATEGIYQTTRDGRFIIANPAIVKRLGYDSFEEMAACVKDIGSQIYVNPEDRKKILDMIDMGLDVKGYETQFYKKDGSKIWVSINMHPIYDEEGNIMYYQGIDEDITDRKNKEMELKSLHEQLFHAQKMEALGTLAGGIAHDFNNILTAITGYATIMQMRLDKLDQRKKYMDQIISASQRAADLIKNLLAFSRKQPINKAPLDLNAEVMAIEKLLRRLLTENIELHIIPSPENPIVMADRTMISQILFNLTSNAKDAMPDGGKMTIEIDTIAIDSNFIVRHGFGKEGGYVLIKVSDTGIGMDEVIKKKVFDPFFTTKEPGKGTGLGLASVYGIVKQHDGYITVDSAPGEGATFNIYVPVIDSKSVDKDEELRIIKGGHETILLAEDDDEVRSFIEEILESYGYRVFVAKDGDEAVSVFKDIEKTDLLISDLVMPKKNGLALYRELKKQDNDLKAIFISGYTKDMISSIPPNEDYQLIQKPLTANELLTRVREVLDR
ncbi:MAG: PAS domain S-box protein [Syntrophorhabdaceae bacterium]|nr:PAS domain S-box protein [Syntrophorhabdaceae bacterium]